MSDAMSNFLENEVRNAVFRTTDIVAYPGGTPAVGTKCYATTGDGNIYVCTTSGATSGEPTWNTALGATTADGAAVWTTCQAGFIKQPLSVALFDTSASLANLEQSTLTGEFSGNGYARVALNPGDANWTAPADGTSANATAVVFAAATADWAADVRFVAIMGLNDEVLFAGQFANDKTVLNGQVFQFNTGDILTSIS